MAACSSRNAARPHRISGAERMSQHLLRRAVATFWSPHLALVLLEGKDVIAFRRLRGSRRPCDRERLRTEIFSFFHGHAASELVLETRLARYLTVRPRTHSPLRIMPIGDAYEWLLP